MTVKLTDAALRMLQREYRTIPEKPIRIKYHNVSCAACQRVLELVLDKADADDEVFTTEEGYTFCCARFINQQADTFTIDAAGGIPIITPRNRISL